MAWTKLMGAAALGVVLGLGTGCTQDEPPTAMAPATDAAVEMEVDPVCGMRVDPRTAPKVEHAGKTYYFCDPGEKADFEKDPEKYLKKDE